MVVSVDEEGWKEDASARKYPVFLWQSSVILGGSGAGKTTFVNAVTGYEKAKAQILQDGVDVYENYGKLKHSIGFVPRQDLLRDDTVRNTLLNAAEMRPYRKYTEKEHRERVDRVLDMFGLAVQNLIL